MKYKNKAKMFFFCFCSFLKKKKQLHDEVNPLFSRQKKALTSSTLFFYSIIFYFLFFLDPPPFPGKNINIKIVMGQN